MRLGTHVIFGTYGFWLPNDPRGSWSSYVWNQDLYSHSGRATKVNTTHSRASDTHDHRKRLNAKSLLKHPAAMLSICDVQWIADAFEECFNSTDSSAIACAIMPDHVHLLLGELPEPLYRFIGRLKSKATTTLRSNQLWDHDRPLWAKKYWQYHIDDERHIQACIKYIQRNPIEINWPKQHWPFIISGHL